jgi:hypothetical protein
MVVCQSDIFLVFSNDGSMSVKHTFCIDGSVQIRHTFYIDGSV